MNKSLLAVCGTVACVATAFNVCAAQALDLYGSYNRIGNQALSKNKIAMAEVMYARAFEQAQKYGDGDQRVVHAAIKLADLYAKQNEYVLAKPIYEDLVRIANNHPEHGLAIAASLDNYSKLLSRLNMNERASLNASLAETIRSSATQIQVGQSGTSF